MTALDELTSLKNIEPAQFKAAMRCMASTVTVITSRAASALNGMTATAVSSVSATPPCMLVVVNQSNRSHALIEKTGAYVVNVLSSEQTSLAGHFASKSESPLDGMPYHVGVTGIPILHGCVAHLECVVESQTRSGTHSVFIGRVVSASESDRLPLMYRNGEFSRYF